MTIGILSWGAEKTLKNTLESYTYYELTKQDEQCIVLLQEGTSEQEGICRYFGWTPVTIPGNIGIAQGYKRLVEMATGEYFLFLENDWKLIDWPSVGLMFGQNLLGNNKADIIRYRHRTNPGSPLWTRQFRGREYDRPSHLLDSLHWSYPPTFPEITSESFKYHMLSSIDDEPIVQNKTMDWYITSAQYANWTNNPHMAKTQFLKDNILPRLGSRDLELDIQDWWQEQDFKVAQSDGLFTHERID